MSIESSPRIQVSGWGTYAQQVAAMEAVIAAQVKQIKALRQELRDTNIRHAANLKRLKDRLR